MPKSILLPYLGQPKIIDCDFRKHQAQDILKTDALDNRTVTWMDPHGYQIVIFCKDMVDHSKRNALASLIGKIDMCEDCLIINDGKDLTLDDLSWMISFSIDNEDDEAIKLFIKQCMECSQSDNDV